MTGLSTTADDASPIQDLDKHVFDALPSTYPRLDK